ncbi:putative Holliday jonction resolvase [Serratia symbiotica str. 'Cinara cedri']|nr:putative Holliday jonction resolvase [Serratia symbiotica str. 'Cinara cedri']
MGVRTVIAFDFGSKSIGSAIGHELTGCAHALAAFKAHDGSPDWQKVAKLLEEWQPDIVVVGLPFNMDGSEQWTTRQARKFASQIHGRFSIKTVYHDERLSTVEARAKLFAHGGFRALNKSSIDSVSAVVILESWLECQQS